MCIVLLNSSESLETKCISLYDEPYMIKPTLIELNPVELSNIIHFWLV